MTIAISPGSGRRLRRVIMLAAIAATAVPSRAGLVDTTWSLQDSGLWSGTSNWSSGRPSNNVPAGTTYNALIDGGQAYDCVVTLDMNPTIAGLWISAGDQLDFNNSRDLTIVGDGSTGTIVNSGRINLNSTGSTTDLILNAAITLGGDGTLSLQSAARVRGSGTLIIAGNTIQGAGALGYNAIAIENQNLIDANISGGTLTIDPAPVGGVMNAGTIQAGNGATLTISGNLGGTFNNASGWIKAQDGSQVRLASGVAVTGGNLGTSGTGSIAVATSDGSLSNLANSGNIVVENMASLYLFGSIGNSGSININSTASNTDLIIDGQVTLNGSGTIAMASFARLRGSGTLLNQDNVIHGEGAVGFNAISMTNSGVIRADQAAKTLSIDPAASGQLANTGTLQASNGATLSLSGNFGGTFNNVGGWIQAMDGAQIRLVSAAAITGGTLATQGSGMIAISSSDGTFSDLTNVGNVVVENSAALYLLGAIANSGSINVNSTASYTDLIIDGQATLSGSGTVTMASFARIRGSGTLVNADHTIQGNGWIGRNALTVVNEGTIIASGGALNLDPPGSGALTNNGLLKALTGGALEFDASNGGGFDGVGSIQIDSGGTASFVGSPAFVSGDILNNGALVNMKTASVGRIEGGGSVVLAAGTLTADVLRQGAATLDSSTRIVIRPDVGADTTSRVAVLAMAATSVLDLNDNDLIIDYDGASPYSMVKSQIASAWHNGARDGYGIRSSTADGLVFGLGYADNTMLNYVSFSGQPVDSTSVLLKYTWYGDSNLDGKVDIHDLLMLATHWNSSADWMGGDFNYDGVADRADLTFVARNWQAGVGAPMGLPLDAMLGNLGLGVPEPCAAALVLLPVLLGRRRRRLNA